MTVTQTVEDVGAKRRFASVPAQENAALARRRSAAASAVPLPLRPMRRAAKVPAIGTRPESSPAALSCLIATLPRSGSWLLAEALYNAGVAGYPHEYFRPDFRDVWAHEWQMSPSAPIEDYIAAAQARTRTPNGVFSAKVHWYQLVWLYGALAPGRPFTDVGAADTLARNFEPLRYVFLSRLDTARQAISYYRASRTQKWFDKGSTHDSPDLTSIDLQQIRWFEDVVVEHRNNWRRYFTATGIKPVEVHYERLADSYEETVAWVLAELGIASEPTESLAAQRTLARQADDRTEAILAEYLRARDQLAPKGPAVRWEGSGRRFVDTESDPAQAQG
jgi:LPS sulfotransferase NodH